MQGPGQNAGRIIAQCERDNLPIPEWINQAPKLLPGLELYMSAFFSLDTERSHAMGLTCIPDSAIRSYAAYYGFEGEQEQALFHHVRKLDIENLRLLEAKNKAEAAKRSKK